MTMTTSKLAVAAAILMMASAAGAQVSVDPDLSSYTASGGVSGTISSVGSDTMNNEMALWAEGFRTFYPNVKIEVEGKGSSTAPPALVAGTSTFGPMSRQMKAAEVDSFEAKYGYKPTALATSIDMLAIYVNKDNPLASLTLQQVDAIFSKMRKGGYAKDIRTWGDLGLSGKWADKAISIYGRNSASGTYGYLKKHALFGGDYKDSVMEQPGSSSVVQAVARDLYAIGYSGIGYKTADVRAVALAPNPGETAIPAEPKFAYTGEYPLARFLYLNVNYKPASKLEPLRAEFLRFLFSREGQRSVVKDGYFPVPATLASSELAKVGLAPKRTAQNH